MHATPAMVHETTTTTGTGVVTLAGAVSGARTFASALSASDTCLYGMRHRSAAEWEVGVGTFNTTLTRTTVIQSSNGNAAVNFSAGTKDVFICALSTAGAPGALTVTPSTDQDDYNPTGLLFANWLRVNASAAISISGFGTGYLGRRLVVENASTDYLLILPNENTNSGTATNRMTLPKGFPAFLMPGDLIVLLHNGSRWLVESWPSQGPAMGLVEFTDFAGGSLSGPFQQTTNGTGAFVGAGSIGVNTTERVLGPAQLDTGTTTTGRATLGFNSSSGIVPTLGPALSVIRAAIGTPVDGTETYSCILGFQDAAGGTWNDGAAWEYRWTGSAAEMSQSRAAGGSITRSNTGSPSAPAGSTFIWAVVFLNANWSRTDYIYSNDSVSFVKSDSPTTGMPGNTQYTGFGASIIKSAGTTARGLHLDFMGYRVDHVRA